MLKLLRSLNPLVLLIIATVCEVCGDAVIRMALCLNRTSNRLG